MNRVNVVLDDETLALLDALVEGTGASRSEHIRRAVAAYVKEASGNMKRSLDNSLARALRPQAQLPRMKPGEMQALQSRTKKKAR